MGENSAIEWTNHTFNPWVGCTKIGPGCDHCYAEGWAKRSGLVTWGKDRRRTSPANWRKPLKWNAEAGHIRPRVFCASLADVFDNEVPEQWRADLFYLIRQTPRLDWLLLTKRIGNAWPMIQRAMWSIGMHAGMHHSLPANVWLGATVVNQQEADRDIEKLLCIPAAIHFLSVEPMLGPIKPNRLHAHCPTHDYDGGFCSGGTCPDLQVVDWMIVGGESGSQARSMNPDWARGLQEHCRRVGIAFFMKQMTGKTEIPADLLVREFPHAHTSSEHQHGK
jgi:protein gp37